MANGVLQNVGTILRHTSAAWQRIVPDPTKPNEVETLFPARQRGLDVVAALDKLGVGSDPDPESVEVKPTAKFVKLGQVVVFDALTRLKPLTVAELGAQFNDFKELIDRIDELDKAVAIAQIR